MKKKTYFYTLLLSSLLLCSCGSKDGNHPIAGNIENEITDDTEDNGFFKMEETPSSATNVEEQLSLIAANSSLWLGDIDGICYQYAITDLDRNGRLEIITSYTEGTGHYSHSQFLEVNEALDELVCCEPNWTEGDSEPDITVDTTPVYYDLEHNAYLYVFDDFLKVSAAEYYENRQTLSLQNNRIVSCVLATRTSIYSTDSEEPTVTCTLQTSSDFFQSVLEDSSSFWSRNTSDDNDTNDCESPETVFEPIDITNEEYEQVADTILASYKKKSAVFKWMGYDFSETKDMDYETLYHILEESYEGFSIQ